MALSFGMGWAGRAMCVGTPTISALRLYPIQGFPLCLSSIRPLGDRVSVAAFIRLPLRRLWVLRRLFVQTTMSSVSFVGGDFIGSAQQEDSVERNVGLRPSLRGSTKNRK